MFLFSLSLSYTYTRTPPSDYEDGSTASVRFTDDCSRLVRVNGEAHLSSDASDYNFVSVQECTKKK